MTKRIANDAQTQAWRKEYTQAHSIDSTNTNRAESCVAWFRQWLSSQDVRPGRLLDVGCGLGRNSLPFLKQGWRVWGQDVVPEALQGYGQRAPRYQAQLTLVERSLALALPYKNAFFDAALEITVADNLHDPTGPRRLWRELSRVIKPGGYLLTYYFTEEDGFYGRLLRKTKPASRSEAVVLDRKGQMQFRFYNAAEIVRDSQGRFQVWQAKHYRYPGPMHGRRYTRDLVAVVLKRMKGAGTHAELKR